MILKRDHMQKETFSIEKCMKTGPSVQRLCNGGGGGHENELHNILHRKSVKNKFESTKSDTRQTFLRDFTFFFFLDSYILQLILTIASFSN